jgi:hypothetical protein
MREYRVKPVHALAPTLCSRFRAMRPAGAARPQMWLSQEQCQRTGRRGPGRRTLVGCIEARRRSVTPQGEKSGRESCHDTTRAAETLDRLTHALEPFVGAGELTR